MGAMSYKIYHEKGNFKRNRLEVKSRLRDCGGSEEDEMKCFFFFLIPYMGWREREG